jgi:hypothetical protein
LTEIAQIVYRRGYDNKVFCSHLCNRNCWRFYCASSVADSGRITCSITNACKASRDKESPNNGVTRRGCCIAFACRVARSFAQGKARSQKSGGGSSRVTVAW